MKRSGLIPASSGGVEQANRYTDTLMAAFAESETVIGEAIIESAIHTSLASGVIQSSGSIQATSLASVDWDFVMAKVNEQLIEKAGIKILRIDKK